MSRFFWDYITQFGRSLFVFADWRDDTINLEAYGEAHNAVVFGGGGDDIIIGSDLIKRTVAFGGYGNDTMIAASGNNPIHGEPGGNLAVYGSAPFCVSNYYNGGRGIDTLELRITAKEWSSDPDLRLEIQNFISSLDGPSRSPWFGSWNYGYFDNPYTFAFLDLKVTGFEILKVVVDGVEIDPFNNAPDAVDDAVTTAEDTPVSGNVLDNDSDIDGSPITVTEVDGVATNVGIAISLSSGSLLTVNADGTFVYQPLGDFHGTDSFAYTISDGGITDIATVVITVDPVNDPPLLPPLDLGAIDEDSSRTITEAELVAGVIDVDGPGLFLTEFSIFSGGGTLVKNSTGGWTYTPVADNDTEVSFSLGFSDGLIGVEGLAFLDLVPVNDAPVATDISLQLLEDQGIGSTFQAIDPDNDPADLVFSVVSSPSNGIVQLVGTSGFTYVPNFDFNGSDSFIFQVADPGGKTDLATVSIVVAPENDPPVAADDNFSGDEDTVIAGNVLSNDTDADGDLLSVVAATILIAGKGTVELQSDGAYTFSPLTDFNGTASFDYTVEDGNGGSDTGTATIAVAPVNDAPIASEVDLGTIEENSSRIITAAELLDGVSDVDGPAVSITALSIDSGGGNLVDNGGGSWTYHPAVDDDGDVTFSYSASDGALSASSTAILDLTAINVAPLALDDAFGSDNDLDAVLVGDGAALLGINNDGNGNFAVSTLASGDGIDRDGVAFGDLNGDGSLDLFVVTGGQETVWINDGTGALTELTGVTPLDDDRNFDVELADMDDDGDLDAVVTSQQNEANRIWLNNGNATFVAGADLTVVNKDRTYDVGLADLDADGDIDIVEANDGQNRIWLNQGNGAFAETHSIVFGDASADSRDVALADLDGDDDVDIFIANRESGNTVWLNNGDTVNPVFTEISGGLGIGESRGVALGDVDGNGTIDAFVANSGTPGDAKNDGAPNALWLNDGAGNYTLSTNNGVPLGDGVSLDVELVDFDSDGDLDALIANNEDGQPNLIWFNDGSGNFTSDGRAIGTFAASDVALGDLDGDAALATDQIHLLDVLANDADPNPGDSLMITSITPGVLAGALSIAPDGLSIRFDPSQSAAVLALAKDALGTFAFDYAISDGKGGTDTASALVTVRGAFDAPAVEGGIAVQGINEGSQWNVVVAADTFSDIDGDGGFGGDTYVFRIGDGNVTITDFDPGLPGPGTIGDQIQLLGFGLSFGVLDTSGDGIVNANDANVSGTGGPLDPLALQLGPNDLLLLDGIPELTPDEFLFV